MNKRRNWLYSTGAVVALLALIGLGTAVNAHPPTDPPSPASAEVTLDKIAPTSRALFTAQPSGAQLEYWVILRIRPIPLIGSPPPSGPKGWYVYNPCAVKPIPPREPLLAQLSRPAERGRVRTSRVLDHQPFVVTGDLASAQALAANPAVPACGTPRCEILRHRYPSPALPGGPGGAGSTPPIAPPPLRWCRCWSSTTSARCARRRPGRWAMTARDRRRLDG